MTLCTTSRAGSDLKRFEPHRQAVLSILGSMISAAVMRDRGVLQDYEDADMDRLPMHNVFPRLSETPGAVRRAAPELGQDNQALLAELGYDQAAQQVLARDGVL